jgi:hypothetical protein
MASKSIVGRKIWVLTGQSESGDSFGPITFQNKPTQKTLRQMAYDWDGTSEGDGLGDYGSYVFLSLKEIEIQ